MIYDIFLMVGHNHAWPCTIMTWIKNWLVPWSPLGSAWGWGWVGWGLVIDIKHASIWAARDVAVVMSMAQRNREEFVTCRRVRDTKSFAARVWVSLVKRHFSWFVVDVGSTSSVVSSKPSRPRVLSAVKRVNISCERLLLTHRGASDFVSNDKPCSIFYPTI